MKNIEIFEKKEKKENLSKKDEIIYMENKKTEIGI